MSLSDVQELPELHTLAAAELALGEAARLEIEQAKLTFRMELKGRDFQPIDSLSYGGQQDAQKQVLAFVESVWLTLARDEVRRSGASKVDRNAINEAVLRVFLEEEWLARYLAAETDPLFKHLIETVSGGTPEFWRRFAINEFLPLGHLSEELELRIRVEVLQSAPGEEPLARDVQDQAGQVRGRRRGNGSLTSERTLALYKEMGRHRTAEGLTGRAIAERLDGDGTFKVKDLPEGRTWSGQAPTFSRLYDHRDEAIRNAFRKFVSATSQKYATSIALRR